MAGHTRESPSIDSKQPLSAHGSSSPEAVRPNLAGLKSRGSHLQYSPQDPNNTPFSPITNASSGTYSNTASNNGGDGFSQPQPPFKRSNSDNMARGQDGSGISHSRPSQRHASFGVTDSKSVEFSRPPLQATVGPYGLLNSSSSNQNYHNNQSSPQSYVSQQNFTPFTLPPPGFNTSATTSSRDSEPVYSATMSSEYQNEAITSGPDMMLLDQMTAPSAMPVFGGEGYNRSPFAIPEDFVAYLFSGQQMDPNSSPMGQMSQQGYAK